MMPINRTRMGALLPRSQRTEDTVGPAGFKSNAHRSTMPTAMMMMTRLTAAMWTMKSRFRFAIGYVSCWILRLLPFPDWQGLCVL